MILSTALLALISSAILLASDTTTRAFRTGSAVATLEGRAQETLDEIAERLQSSSLWMVDPDARAPFFTDSLDYQRAVDYVDGAVQWGPPERIFLESDPADANDGVDNDGDGLIDECRVVWVENPMLAAERRVVLCNWVAEALEGEDLDDGDDENLNTLEDERGLSFDFAGNSVTIRLTLQRMDQDGFLLTRTLERTVSFRNDGGLL